MPKPISLGFTGNRKGMTASQYLAVEHLMLDHTIVEAHHGGCVGSDAEFHHLCLRSYNLRGHIFVHWSNLPKVTRMIPTSHMVGLYPKPPLERNRNIVKESDYLIVVPGGYKEVLRSGTWATYRQAKRTGVPRYVVYLDGTVIPEV